MTASTENHYINDTDFYFEIILSKGRGYRSAKLDAYFILIAENMRYKLSKKSDNWDENDNNFQEGILTLMSNWESFNEKKYQKALPYFSELFKRAWLNGHNSYNNIKYNIENPLILSIDHLSMREEK